MVKKSDGTDQDEEDGVGPTVIAITASTPAATEFHWGRQQVLALISKVEEFFEDFYDGTKKKKVIWQAVADRMQEDGFNCSGSECDKKWRNLKGTYVKVLQKQIHGETSYRFEYFDALHHILGKEIDPLGMREQVMTNGGPVDPLANTVVTDYHEITVDGGLVWSEAAVLILLDLLHRHRLALSSPTSLDSAWQEIAQGMEEGGYEADSEKCQRKWVNLLEGFHFHQAQAKANATVPLWAFFTRVRDLANSTNIPTHVSHSPVSSHIPVSGKRKRGRGRGCSRGRGGVEPDSSSVVRRVRQLEASVGVGQRLEHLEARVEAACHHQDAYKHTNTILTQILSELRQVNNMLEQDGLQGEQQEHESLERHQSEQNDEQNDLLDQQDESSCSSNQGIIIVEAYAD